jgi:hypothetical protein
MVSLFSLDGRRDISLKKSPKTRTNYGRARLAFAPRAFLQFFHRDVPPLTLVDAVVLRHALRMGQAGSEQNFVLVVCSSEIDLPEF